MSFKRKEEGFSSFLLIAVLLVMAISIPLIAKLVQNNNVDNRSRAGYSSCSTSGQSCTYTETQLCTVPGSGLAGTKICSSVGTCTAALVCNSGSLVCGSCTANGDIVPTSAPVVCSSFFPTVPNCFNTAVGSHGSCPGNEICDASCNCALAPTSTPAPTTYSGCVAACSGGSIDHTSCVNACKTTCLAGCSSLTGAMKNTCEQGCGVSGLTPSLTPTTFVMPSTSCTTNGSACSSPTSRACLGPSPNYLGGTEGGSLIGTCMASVCTAITRTVWSGNCVVSIVPTPTSGGCIPNGGGCGGFNDPCSTCCNSYHGTTGSQVCGPIPPQTSCTPGTHTCYSNNSYLCSSNNGSNIGYWPTTPAQVCTSGVCSGGLCVASCASDGSACGGLNNLCSSCCNSYHGTSGSQVCGPILPETSCAPGAYTCFDLNSYKCNSNGHWPTTPDQVCYNACSAGHCVTSGGVTVIPTSGSGNPVPTSGSGSPVPTSGSGNPVPTTGTTTGGSCGYSSLQARVQPVVTVNWDSTLSLGVGQSANLLCSHDSVGQIASNVQIKITHTDGTIYTHDAGTWTGWVAPKSGTFSVTCKSLASACTSLSSDTSTLTVSAASVSPTTTVEPALACTTSGGGGTLAPGGTVSVTMTANRAIDSGRLDIYNQEHRNDSNIPIIVKNNGQNALVQNGTLSTDRKTITYVVNYSDLAFPDSNYNNAYLKDVQLNGVVSIGSTNSSYTASCVKFITMNPRPSADTVAPAIAFKMAFNGLLSTAKCAPQMALQLVVLGNGVTKTYANVIPVKDSVVNGKQIYSARKVLDGFTTLTDVAAFLRGPKHLQMKYGKNSQTAMYNQAGGELTLVRNGSSGETVYDFSGYPLLAGDVNQDGAVNGQDFSIVKGKALKFETVSEGQSLDADLDGDCMATNNDVQILRLSLQEKQGQLY